MENNLKRFNMCNHKYLERRGFTVFEFGVHPDGTVDVSNGDGVDVVVGVTREQAEQIQKYISDLFNKTTDYIETFYEENV